MTDYEKRLIELAKSVEECNVELVASSDAVKFQSRLNHLLGYIKALEDGEENQ